MNTTRQELALRGIQNITEDKNLHTVSFVNNGWVKNGGLVCVNDDGIEVEVRPNWSEWEDGTKDVKLSGRGVYAQLWFSKDSNGYSLDMHRTTPDSFKAGLKLPPQVLQWALDKAV